MEFVNYFTSQKTRPRSCIEPLVLMLAPLAPHIGEELWQALGHAESLAQAPWPVFDERYTREDTIEVPVQINGRLRGHVTVPASAANEQIREAALCDEKIQRYIEGSTVRKVIVVPGKLVSIVISPK